MTQPDAATQDHDGAAASGAEAPGPGGPNAGGLGSVLYKLALAGVGALILAQEEIEAAWKRARGERGEGDEDAGDDGTGAPTNGAQAQEPAAADGADRADRAAPDGTRVWLQIDAAIGRGLRSLPMIPTREEVDELANKVEALAARIEARSRRSRDTL